MVFDINNNKLRLLLRSLIAYEKSGSTDAQIDKVDIIHMKAVIMELLKQKRFRNIQP